MHVYFTVIHQEIIDTTIILKIPIVLSMKLWLITEYFQVYFEKTKYCRVYPRGFDNVCHKRLPMI